MNIPVFATEEQTNGSTIIVRYDRVKGDYIPVDGEIYFSEKGAKIRAKELNEGVPPVVVPDIQGRKHYYY